jgi:hypothetical protein
MKLALISTLGLAILAGTSLGANAQVPNINLMPELKSKTPEEIEREQQLQREYRESLRKIPDAKAAADPWGDVRGAEAAPKAAAKPKAAARAAKDGRTN